MSRICICGANLSNSYAATYAQCMNCGWYVCIVKSLNVYCPLFVQVAGYTSDGVVECGGMTLGEYNSAIITCSEHRAEHSLRQPCDDVGHLVEPNSGGPGSGSG